jgi:hypothetical protein
LVHRARHVTVVTITHTLSSFLLPLHLCMFVIPSLSVCLRSVSFLEHHYPFFVSCYTSFNILSLLHTLFFTITLLLDYLIQSTHFFTSVHFSFSILSLIDCYILSPVHYFIWYMVYLHPPQCISCYFYHLPVHRIIRGLHLAAF